MAGRSRSVEFDLLVTGTEKGGAKVERLGDKFDDLGDKVDKLDGKTARVKGIVKLEKDTDRLGDTIKAMGAKVLTGGAAVLKFASVAGLALGAVGPLAIGIGVAAVAAAHFALEMSGAAAALAPLAVGAIFVQQTLKAMGDEFVKAVEPMAKAWQKSTTGAANLATKGIRPLAREFVKLNFPAIARAQERIGVALNTQLRGFVGWLNAAQGQEVIARLTEDTATAFETLAPAVREVTQSFVAMLGRVSQISFNSVTDGLAYLLSKLSGFIDTINANDVDRGVGKLVQSAQAISDAFNKIGDAIRWVEANRQKILQLSDAILVLTAVGAALVGGWFIALGAGLLLLARHWNDLKGAASGFMAAIQNLPKRFTTLQGVIDSFGDAWARIKDGFRDFVAQVGPKLQPFLDDVTDGFIKMQPAIAAAVTVTGAWIQAMLKVAGPIVAGVIEGLGLLINAFGDVVKFATKMAGAMLSAFASVIGPIAAVARKFKLPFADALTDLADGARQASNRINSSMKQVDTDLARNEIGRLQRTVSQLKGKKIKTEADRKQIAESIKRIGDLQRKVNSTHGKTITVSVDTIFKKPKGTPSAGFGGGGLFKAEGGPVQKGRPYIVGEKRPELFVPKQSGTIVPRVPTGFSGGGGGGGNTYVFQFPNYVGSKRELAAAIRSEVKHVGGGDVQRAFGRAR